MTKHRTITGLAVALIAAATTAATIGSHSSSADRAVSNTMSIGELTAAAGMLPTSEFDDQSVVFSTKR